MVRLKFFQIHAQNDQTFTFDEIFQVRAFFLIF